ncbi:DUF885 family protein, partial [Pseudokineococcus marinus]
MPDTDVTAPRRPSAVDDLADAHVDAYAALDPVAATGMGAPGHDDEMTDYSPAGDAARADLARRTLAALEALPAGAVRDDVDAVTVAAMRERLGLEVEMADAGVGSGEVTVLATPLQDVREVFDLMPVATADDWAVVARRLALVPDALAGYTTSLRAACDGGRAPARRQVRAGAEQAAEFAAAGGFF